MSSRTSRWRRNAPWLAAPAIVRTLVIAALAASCSWSQSRLILETSSDDDLSRVAGQYSLTLVQPVQTNGRNVWLVSAGADASLTPRLSADPGVVAVEPDGDLGISDHQAQAADASSLLNYLNDVTPLTYYGTAVRSGYVQQPATSIIRLTEAHAEHPAGAGIVAVIDTGVDPAHPVLANVLIPGYDFIQDAAGDGSELGDVSQSTVAILDQSTVAILDSKNSPVILNQSTVAILDQSTVAILDTTQLPAAFGHGTMVAGLVHLVAPQAMIMPLKAFSADGTGRLSDVIRAIYYAADHNVTVINMSFSYPTPSPGLQRAVQYAASKGVICIASVGNAGHQTTVYPAGYDGVIGVGSTNNSDQRSAFSNYGTMANVGSPGEALITLYPGGNYAEVWGTSFSAPLVSGAASLMQAVTPSATYRFARRALSRGPQVPGVQRRLDLDATLDFCTQPHEDDDDDD